MRNGVGYVFAEVKWNEDNEIALELSSEYTEALEYIRIGVIWMGERLMENDQQFKANNADTRRACNASQELYTVVNGRNDDPNIANNNSSSTGDGGGDGSGGGGGGGTKNKERDGGGALFDVEKAQQY